MAKRHQHVSSLIGTVAVAGAVAIGIAGAAQPVVLLGFIVLLVVVALLLLVRRSPEPALSACVFILLIAATKFRYRDSTASLSAEVDSQVVLELFLYALLAAALGVIWRSRRLQLRPIPQVELLLFAYVVLATTSSLWSTAPLLTLSRAVQLWVLFFAALVLVRGLPPTRLLHTLSMPLVCYVLVFASLAVAWPSAAGGRVEYGLARFSWFAVHPITAATLAGIGALVLGIRLSSKAGEQFAIGRPWLWLAVVTLVVIAVLTRSRGPLIALLGGAMVAVIARRLSGATAALAGSAVAVGALVLANSSVTLLGLLADWSADQGSLNSLVFRGQGADAVAGFSGRARLWAEIMPLIREDPWFGRGFQGARADLLQLASWAGHAHNAVLQSLLDLGLSGSVLLFAAFASILIVGPVRSALVDPRTRLVRVTVVSIGMFELLNAVSNPSFAGAPGYETLLVFTSICLAPRIRRSPGRRPLAESQSWGNAVAARPAASDAYVGAEATAPSTSSS